MTLEGLTIAHLVGMEASVLFFAWLGRPPRNTEDLQMMTFFTILWPVLLAAILAVHGMRAGKIINMWLYTPAEDG